jgi:hypothetical protein
MGWELRYDRGKGFRFFSTITMSYISGWLKTPDNVGRFAYETGLEHARRHLATAPNAGVVRTSTGGLGLGYWGLGSPRSDLDRTPEDYGRYLARYWSAEAKKELKRVGKYPDLTTYGWRE